MHATLWQCSKCNAFIAIHSPYRIVEPLCPLCGDVDVDFCGEFHSMFGMQLADA
jgi:predicted RNA-binding Zn-ribbon protein involved in translation (DUF1610 family)